MAEIWGAALVVAGAAYSANKQAGAAEDAANATTAASNAGIAEQRRQFDLTRSDQQPWLVTGQGSLAKQNAFLNGDLSGFQNSPDYQFTLAQGLQAQDRSAAANGNLFSGGHSADLMRFGQGLASQHADNYWNKLAGLSGTGQITAGNLGQMGMGMANNIGLLGMNAANARASAYTDKANAWGNFSNQAMGAYGDWFGGLGQDEHGRYLGNQRGKN